MAVSAYMNKHMNKQLIIYAYNIYIIYIIYMRKQRTSRVHAGELPLWLNQGHGGLGWTVGLAHQRGIREPVESEKKQVIHRR